MGLRQQQAPPVSLRRRAVSIPTLVSLALAGAFLFFLINRFEVDPRATWTQIQDGNPWYLASAFLVHYTTFIFRGARWRIMLRRAQDESAEAPGVLYCSQLTLLSWFANSVAWFRLGDAYRAYLYHQERGVSFSRAIGTILAERLLDTLLVVALLLAAAPFLLANDARVSLILVGTAAALLGLLLLALLAMAGARARLAQWLPQWLADRYQRFYEGALGSFERLPLVTVLGLFGWLAEIGRVYLVVQALRLDLSLPLIVFIALANSLLTLAPTPGGFGAVEPGVAGLVVRLSALSTSAAAALVLVDRSISYVSVILVGVVLFLTRHLKRRSFTPREPVDIEQG